MELDTANWSGDGDFTLVLIDALQRLTGIAFLKIEDAPASRADAGFSFISNEIFVGFQPDRQKPDSIAALAAQLEADAAVGPADYFDEGMIQYLKAERIMRPYQSRGYKQIEMVRIYKIGTASRASI